MKKNIARLTATFTASGLLGVSLPANATLLTTDISASLSDAAIWDGAAPIFLEDLAKTPDLLPTIGPDVMFEPKLTGIVADAAELIGLPTSFGSYGVQAGLSMDATVALRSQLTNFHVGTLDLSYAANVALEFPDQVERGQTYTISSSLLVDPTSAFSTTSNAAQLDLGANFALSADLVAKACFATCFLDKSYNLYEQDEFKSLITQTNTATTLNVFDEINVALGALGLDPLANPTFNQAEISVEGGNLLNPIDFVIAEATNFSGVIGAPDISTSSTISGNQLIAAGTDVFTSVDVDLDGFAKLPLGIDLKAGEVAFGGDLFDATLNTSLIQRQQFTFDAAPMLTLDLGALGIYQFRAGDSIQITIPDTIASGLLTFNPVVTLANTFTNLTTVAAAQDTVITIGRLTVKLPSKTLLNGVDDVCIGIPTPLGCGGVEVDIPDIKFPGVDFDEHIFSQSINDPLFSLGPLDVTTCSLTPSVCNNFSLFGINGPRTARQYQNTQSFNFGTYSLGLGQIFVVPEPGTVSLLSLGFVLLLLRRRRPEQAP